ncbi:MAG: BLUF domain-containing protein [Pelagimonas sp.]|uniref:BLUF domain-containing protein n=1 Tax=Pelagimonas sp. TaxID=2073170 RepID=UPI003D6AB614
MHFLIYSSTALVPETDIVAHDSILLSALDVNPRLGLTGFLHRERQFFLQYLEGDEQKIDILMEKIWCDKRHKDIHILARGPLKGRLLPDWSMGFVNGHQLALRDMLESDEKGLRIRGHDPVELVQFFVINADSLSQRLAA